MNKIPRFVESSIEESLFKGKLVIIYGARQVGKTTLAKKILEKYGSKGKYFNCELLPVQEALAIKDAGKLKAFLGDSKLVVLDEAQNIPDVGKILKIMVDTYPKLQIIATGSSSFDLAQKISEPMTGRTFTYLLYPVSVRELWKQKDLFFVESKLENLLRFGGYPEIIDLEEVSAKQRLSEITSDYLYKDILIFEGIKKSSLIKNLLRLLALQLGQEVSYNELAMKLGINRLTVQKYIDILEQCFVVFRLEAFSRNLRKEISKSIKIYFYDLGIRNSIIENYNRLDVRTDVGALWENFCIVERMKNNAADSNFVNAYFWRTYDQKEVDYVEEAGGKITGYEFKWNGQKKYKAPKDFTREYEAEVKKIDKDNYWEFLGQV
jgi:predicted AAA+ superfamily ATPase